MTAMMVTNLFEDFPGFGLGRFRRVAKIEAPYTIYNF